MRSVRPRSRAACVLVTFRIRHSQAKCIVATAVCVSCMSVCLSGAAFLHYCTDPGVNFRNGSECLLVVHYWAVLQSVHMRLMRNVSEAVWLVPFCGNLQHICWISYNRSLCRSSSLNHSRSRLCLITHIQTTLHR